MKRIILIIIVVFIISGCVHHRQPQQNSLTEEFDEVTRSDLHGELKKTYLISKPTGEIIQDIEVPTKCNFITVIIKSTKTSPASEVTSKLVQKNKENITIIQENTFFKKAREHQKIEYEVPNNGPNKSDYIVNLRIFPNYDFMTDKYGKEISPTFENTVKIELYCK